MQKDKGWGFFGIFRIIFSKEKGIENKRRGLGVKFVFENKFWNYFSIYIEKGSRK
jgi:predicted DNA-binding protein (UPF0278 family)